MTTPEVPRLPRSVPEWHERAACRDYPGIDWVEAKAEQAHAARMICASCPVRYLCARDALERGEPWGIHGGLDRGDRKQLAREYGYPTPAVLPEHGTNSRYAKHSCRCPECRHAHAVYEVDRRAKARAKSRRRDWFPLVLTRPLRMRRRWVPAGQYLLPLDGVPAPSEADTDNDRGPLALAA